LSFGGISLKHPLPMFRKNSKDYQRKKLELGLAGMILEFLALLAFLLSRLNIHLRDALISLVGGHFLLLLPCYIFTLALAHEILFFPLSYIKGHRLEKEHHLSNQSFTSWLEDHLKFTIIGWALGFLAILCVYALLRRYPEGWWWRAAFLLWIGYILLVKFAPLFIFPLFFKFTPLEDGELKDGILHLSEKAGVRVKGLFSFDMSKKTKAANAAISGLGSTCRILLADNMLSSHSTDEITAVVAHELGHHRHHHLIKGIIINLFFLLLFLFISSRVIIWGIGVFGFQGSWDVASFPLLALVFSIGTMIFLPFVNSLLRSFERTADRFALESTQSPEAFISMMGKLSNENLSDPSPHPLIEFLFYSHPSINKRISLARKFQEKITSRDSSDATEQ